MIFQKKFYHRRLVYPFNWAKTNHLEFQQKNIVCSRVLWRYLNSIAKGHYPQDWFDDDEVPRISQFRLKGLKRGLVPKIGKQMIEEGYIKEYSHDNNLVKLADQVYLNFQKAKIDRKPGHDVILKNILIKDEKSIATEVPVWADKPTKITGHIDLVRIDDETLQVIDYKPEGNFMRTIPQVAYYGLLMKKRFSLKYLKCYSFNKDKIWEYEPEALFDRVNEILNEKELANFDWQYYV